MSELHNTNPLNYMQINSDVARIVIWGGGKNWLDNGMSKTRWGPGRRLNNLDLQFGMGGIATCQERLVLRL